jgi:hypothetical protein
VFLPHASPIEGNSEIGECIHRLHLFSMHIPAFLSLCTPSPVLKNHYFGCFQVRFQAAFSTLWRELYSSKSRTGSPWSHVKALEDKSIRSLGRKLYYQLFILRIIYKASSVPSTGGMHWNIIATWPSSDIPGQTKGSVLHLPTSASLEIIFISPPRMHHH